MKMHVAPSDPFAGDSPFTGSPVEPQSLAKERQPQCVVGSSDVVVRCTSISTHNTGEAHKGCMLNEPCDQWVRDGHVLAQESIQRQVHCPYLALEVTNGHLGGSRRLWIVRYRALGRCRLKLLHTEA